MRSKTVILVAALAGLHLILLFACFVAPYDPASQDRELPYAPPTRLHFEDASGFHLRPFFYASTLVLDGDQAGSYQEEQTRAYPVRLLVRGSSYELLGLY